MTTWTLTVGTARRVARYGFVCIFFVLISFLPMAGLALLSPLGLGELPQREFLLSTLLLCRFLTPPGACLAIAYLAHRESKLGKESSLRAIVGRTALSSMALVLGICLFVAIGTVFMVLPGLAFWLSASVVLPVLVLENEPTPAAIKRSWELTKGHRIGLFKFWLSLYCSLGLMVYGVWSFSSNENLVGELALPLAQQNSFLPLVAAFTVTYTVIVIASYEVYTRLVNLGSLGLTLEAGSTEEA